VVAAVVAVVATTVSRVVAAIPAAAVLAAIWTDDAAIQNEEKSHAKRKGSDIFCWEMEADFMSEGGQITVAASNLELRTEGTADRLGK
jgi:hypothetical protein